MYNQYLSAQPIAAEPLPEPPCAPDCPHSAQKKPAGSGGLQGLAGRLGELKFDADTLIALAVVWFLLSDGDVLDTDLLIIIAVLFLLGI